MGVGEGFGLPEGLGDGVRLGEGLGVADTVGGARIVLFGDEVALAPLIRSAEGTTTIPTSTVMTKAAAPHSRRQKAQDELRIRALLPSPEPACYGC